MFNRVTKNASKSPVTSVTPSETPSDSERDEQPPPPGTSYQPDSEQASVSEPPYNPYP
jgi:hypothetical protein